MNVTMTCPGCGVQVYLDPMSGWRNDAAGYTCAHGWDNHGQACLDKMGRMFHEAGEQFLNESGAASVIRLPRWDDTNELQRGMVYSGIVAALMALSGAS